VYSKSDPISASLEERSRLGGGYMGGRIIKDKKPEFFFSMQLLGPGLYIRPKKQRSRSSGGIPSKPNR
jgi:hypothetical protein